MLCKALSPCMTSSLMDAGELLLGASSSASLASRAGKRLSTHRSKFSFFSFALCRYAVDLLITDDGVAHKELGSTMDWVKVGKQDTSYFMYVHTKQCWGSVTCWCGLPLINGTRPDSFLQWLEGCKKINIFSYSFLKTYQRAYFSPLNTFMKKGKDPYLWLMDPDPRPKKHADPDSQHWYLESTLEL